MTVDRPRIASLDILRGFALLGILVMNIQSFSMIEAAYFNPTAYGDLSGANWIVYYLSAVLVDTKFMGIFSLLFGASALLILEKARAAGKRPFATHARRNLALLAVGFVHGRFLWHGDILWSYALSAFLLYLFRNRSPRFLFVSGTLVLAVGSSLWLGAGMTADQWPAADAQQHLEDWAPGPEAVAHELELYRGSWSQQQEHRGPTAAAMQFMVYPFFFLWRSLGMMLLGMGLYRLGVLNAERSPRFYAILAVAGLGVGLPLAHLRVAVSVAEGWPAFEGFFLYTQYNYWGSIAAALGYVGLVMAVCRSEAWVRRLRPLAAVGRMAFTNYLLHTLLCTTLFYGHGFGLFGKVSRVEQAGVVLAIWILQLVVSPWWLDRFRYGPAEWAWRWATNLERPAFRR